MKSTLADRSEDETARLPLLPAYEKGVAEGMAQGEAGRSAQRQRPNTTARCSRCRSALVRFWRTWSIPRKTSMASHTHPAPTVPGIDKKDHSYGSRHKSGHGAVGYQEKSLVHSRQGTDSRACGQGRFGNRVETRTSGFPFRNALTRYQ